VKDIRSSADPSDLAAVVKLLEYFCQTKARSVEFLGCWLKETQETDVRVGLTQQLVDERRHLRLLTEELRQRGVKISAGRRDARLNRLFDETNTLNTDLHRICAYHRGIKAFTLNRCGALIPVVEERLAALLDQIARDEERHIRWADIRLARLLVHSEMRSANLLMSQVWAVLEAVWEKPWRRVTRLIAV
jgi:hypothetical protein